MPKPKSTKSLSKHPKQKFHQRQLIFNSEHNQRKWFHRHGKQNYLSLSDQVMIKLRQYFNALDSNKCEYISAQDLENPLIVFGLCENSGEVEKIVKEIDTDFSGVIEFDEFVQIFKAAKNNKRVKASKNKFEELAKIMTGDVSKQMQNSVCIQTSISEYCRKLIINLLKKKNQEALINGKRVARQIVMKSDRSDLLPALNRYR